MSSTFMAKWHSGVCETPQVKIHYTRAGEGKATLILLHGLAADGRCWMPVAEAFVDHYDVIMPDARGHGKSSVSHDGYQYDVLADDVERLIEGLELSAPIVIGHSMGGMTAAVLASRNNLLGGLILVDPTFLSLEVQHEVYEGNTVEEQMRFLNKPFEDVLKEAQSRQPHRLPSTIELINKARHQTSLAPFQILKPRYPDFKKAVSLIGCNVLLVIADNGIVSPALADELQALNPNLQYQMILGAGHGLHYDRPKEIVTLVQSFLCSSLREDAADHTLK